jgi:PPM family protein phosphatase
MCASRLPVRPTVDDLSWLAATLGALGSSVSADAPARGVSPVPLEKDREDGLMSEPTSPVDLTPTPELIGDRYQIVATHEDGTLDLRDTQPWRRCWSCGSTGNEQGEAFCTDCGARLEPRTYRAHRTPPDAPAGAALIGQLADPALRSLLPEVWDELEHEGQRYTILAPTTQEPPTLPLDPLPALKVGRDMASLMAALHEQGLGLGPVAAADLTLDATGRPRLRDASGLHTKKGAQAPTADLRQLAALLEELTATPRVTRRLEDDELANAQAQALPNLLSALRTGQIADATTLATQLDALVADLSPAEFLRAQIGAATDKGMVRDHNEDSLLFFELGLNSDARERAWGLYVVADGMGGHAAGEVASNLAIRGAAETVLAEYMAPTLGSSPPEDEGALQELMRRAALRANEYVLGEARARGNDMGTTLTMALVVGDRAYIANVGDSRTYLMRGDELRRVSKDHSLVMRLVDLGQIGDDEIYSHPQRNAVLRSLGDKPEVEVDVFVERLRPGDTLLLCSDGQWEMTRDDAMAQILTAAADPQEAAETLVAEANRNGGEDNIAAIVVRFSV